MTSKWYEGIEYEVAFWEATYKNKKARNSLFKWSDYGKDITLPGFDVCAFLSANNDNLLDILDVGCGLSFRSGTKINGNPLPIHYVDPLAPFFNKILDKYRPDLPKIEFGILENLSAFYAKESSSLIEIQNALDHSSNPIKGIYESLDVLAIGGVLYLNHHLNEAEAENYRGFHQYNISEENGELKIWNKEKNENINELLQGVASVNCCTIDGEVIAVIKKLNATNFSDLTLRDDVVELYSNIIQLAKQQSSLSFAIKRHIRFSYHSMVQYVSKHFSYNTRLKIKKILKHS